MASTFYRRGFWRGTFVLLHRLLPQHLFLGVRGHIVNCNFWGYPARGVRLRIFAWPVLCTDVRAVDRGSALRAWRAFPRRWLGRFTVDRRGLGRGERRGHLGDPPHFAAKYHS